MEKKSSFTEELLWVRSKDSGVTSSIHAIDLKDNPTFIRVKFIRVNTHKSLEPNSFLEF